MNLEAMIIYHCTAYLDITAQLLNVKYVSSFCSPDSNICSRLFLLKKYEGEAQVKQFVFKIPKIETKPKSLNTSNANVQYKPISEHDRFKHTISRYNNTLL